MARRRKEDREDLELKIRNDYLLWLYRIVSDLYSPPENSYLSLFRTLQGIEFFWTNKFDEARAVDGIAIRDAYVDEVGNGDVEIELDIQRALAGPCTVLEMLIGLAKRCEDQLMYRPGEDRTSTWFWMMLNNLELGKFTDDKFGAREEIIVSHLIHKALERDYGYDGYGGFFPLDFPPKNIPEIDLWYQLNYFLQEKGLF